MQWEYDNQVIETKQFGEDKVIRERTNDRGMEGWELVAIVTVDPDRSAFVWKRRLPGH
jgi:hypothetical protein